MKCPILRGGGGSSREMYTLQHLVNQHRGFIAGGYARWALSPVQEPARPSDIDCYFRDLDGMQAFSHAITRSGWKIIRSTGFAIKFNKAYFDLPLHAVCVTGTPGFIVESMDFGICQAVLDHCEGRATDSFMEEEKKKEIRIKHPHNLQLTIQRIMKYQERGYTLPDGELELLFSFFAVRPLSPSESPFANYQILSADPSNVEIPEQPMLTQGPRPSWGVEPLFPVPRGWTAPDRNPRPPLARTRGDITFEELALMQLGPPNRRAPTEEEIADARIERSYDAATRVMEEDI
jgi:hypothetical protein